jgi:RimJ/RimL family protein N-acetyltransferase
MTTNELGQPIGFPVPAFQHPPLPSREPMAGRWCRLEPLAEAHSADLHEANLRDTDSRSWTYLAYGPFGSEEEHRRWLVTTCLGSDPVFFAMVDRAMNKPVGVGAYLRIAPASGSIEVGHLHFSPLLQGTVVATDAMYLMMRHVFELGYRRYEWKCDALNASSRAAARRLGFSFEGIFRQATVYKGRNRDTAWYAVTDREWPALRRAFETWLAPENFEEAGRQRTRLSDLTRPLLVNAE